MHAAVVKSFVCLRVVKSWTTTEFVFEKLPICQNSLSKLEIVLTIDGMYRGINCISLYFKVITIHFHSQTQVWTEFIQPRAAPSGGGGGTPLYKLYRYVLPHRVRFLRRFGLKTGIRFAHFGLESVKVFGGITGVYEGIYRFNSKWVRTKEKHANSKWFDEFVCLRSNLSNDNIISA